MTQAAKQWKVKEHRRNLFIVWAVLFSCWIWYHSAQIPTWLQQGLLRGPLNHSQKVLQDEDFHEVILETLGEEAGNNLSVEDAEETEEASICFQESCGLDELHTNTTQQYIENTQSPQENKARKHCATVEEMGAAATSDTEKRDFEIRDMIQKYFAEHGAQHVRRLSAQDFCNRGFVYGRSNEDGFGNEMYKILSAAGLALMLNRSLIIGEDSSVNPSYLGLSEKIHRPFGDYVAFSNESFTMREVKHMWVIHNCAGKYRRSLNMRIDSIQRPSGTHSLCDDWSKWSQPIIWFYGAQDVVALQFFLKNMHPTMKQAASRILGEPMSPSTRGNLFGELMRAFVSPKPAIQAAVEWTLKSGPDPDIALHLRMHNSRSRRVIEAACTCIRKVLSSLKQSRLPRVVIVTETPIVVRLIRNKLEDFAEVIHFDYKLYLNASEDISGVMQENYFQPPRKRIEDWGPLPRWVALVDFFLASRAKHGVISGGSKRVATTYAQLVASLAAANNLGKHENFKFFSSFHPALLSRGLISQRGWGHAWRTFSGRLSCTTQTAQCALTPLLPHAWWDGPMQFPTSRDARIMRSFGIDLNASGNVVEANLFRFCSSRRKPKPSIVKLELPSCNKLKSC